MIGCGMIVGGGMIGCGIRGRVPVALEEVNYVSR